MSPEQVTRAAKVRAAYEQTARGLGGEDYLLRAVRDLVRGLKSDGETPERVVITIKSLCGMPLVPFAAHHDRFANPNRTRSISETVIGVAIQEYFSSPILDRANASDSARVEAGSQDSRPSRRRRLLPEDR